MLAEPSSPPPRDAYVLVLQHIACEPPGVYEDVMHEHGARLHRVELDAGKALPEHREFDAVVVMGGPMGAYDADSYPWMHAEKRFLRDAIAAGVPVFGACLGAQGPGAIEALLTDFTAERPLMQHHARTLFDAWWRHTVALGRVSFGRRLN